MMFIASVSFWASLACSAAGQIEAACFFLAILCGMFIIQRSES